MLILIFGVICGVTGLAMLVMTFAVAVHSPIVALIVLGPLAAGLFGYLYVKSGEERLRKAIYLARLEQTDKFRRH